MFAERRTVHITFRVTPSQKEQLDRLCSAAGVTQSEYVARALDYFVAAQLAEKGGKGSRVVGSKRRPSAATAKVKATSKRSPSKTTD